MPLGPLGSNRPPCVDASCFSHFTTPIGRFLSNRTPALVGCCSLAVSRRPKPQGCRPSRERIRPRPEIRACSSSRNSPTRSQMDPLPLYIALRVWQGLGGWAYVIAAKASDYPGRWARRAQHGVRQRSPAHSRLLLKHREGMREIRRPSTVADDIRDIPASIIKDRPG